MKINALGTVAGICICVFSALMTGCGPRAHIPLRPLSLERTLAPSDSGAVLARRLAPLLYLQPDEMFPLLRVVAVIHPFQRLIAYNLLWRDDVHGSWIPFTVATDQEVIWVGYDRTNAPTDVWTYWHGLVLHTAWPRKQVAIDVQWGKHGSLPRGMRLSDLPRSHSLNFYYSATIFLLPDILLGDVSRKGPLCFCGDFKRYRDFSVPVQLADKIDFVVKTENPDETLFAVFGHYSKKPIWPAGF